MENIHSFSKSSAEQNKGEKKKKGTRKLESVKVQAVWRQLSYLSGPFAGPSFGVEMDTLREPLQVEKYLKARGDEEAAGET